MWNEINPLTPAGISLAESEFHAQSAFHKSRKGFISLRSVLKGTAHKNADFYLCYSLFIIHRSLFIRQLRIFNEELSRFADE